MPDIASSELTAGRQGEPGGQSGKATSRASAGGRQPQGVAWGTMPASQRSLTTLALRREAGPPSTSTSDAGF